MKRFVEGVDRSQSTLFPERLARLAHAPLQHVLDTELARDPFHVDAASLVSERGVAGDDEEQVKPRQRGDDILGYSIGEILLLRIIVVSLVGAITALGIAGVIVAPGAVF